MKTRLGLRALVGVMMLALLGTGAASADDVPDGPVVGIGGTAVASNLLGVGAPAAVACQALVTILPTEITADTNPAEVRGKVVATARSVCPTGGLTDIRVDVHVYVNEVQVVGSPWVCDDVATCSSPEIEFSGAPGNIVIRTSSDHDWWVTGNTWWNFATPEMCFVLNEPSTNGTHRTACGAEAQLVL